MGNPEFKYSYRKSNDEYISGTTRELYILVRNGYEEDKDALTFIEETIRGEAERFPEGSKERKDREDMARAVHYRERWLACDKDGCEPLERAIREAQLDLAEYMASGMPKSHYETEIMDADGRNLTLVIEDGQGVVVSLTDNAGEKIGGFRYSHPWEVLDGVESKDMLASCNTALFYGEYLSYEDEELEPEEKK